MAGDTESLVTAASQGDTNAVGALLERYLPDLEGYVARHAGRLVRAKESSSDLAQSVCREVLERLADGRFRYQGEAAFRQWLYRAAVMKMLHRDRHWKMDKRDAAREAARPEAPPDASRVPGGVSAIPVEATPSMDAIRAEELELFQRSFEALPERDQEIIRLHHAEGLSHAEIAEELGIAESYSRTLLSRALVELSKLATRS